MAGEPNTAEKQNEIRREQKRKQRLGKGKKKGGLELENVRVSRHVTGSFDQEMQDAIAKRFMTKPEEPITTEFFRQYVKEKPIKVDCGDVHGTVEITEDDIKCSLVVYTVTVFTAGGYGVKFKTVGGRNGKPRRVIIL